MYGDGLAQEDTLPFIVSQNLPKNFNVYNYGQNGYSTSNMLNILEKK